MPTMQTETLKLDEADFLERLATFEAGFNSALAESMGGERETVAQRCTELLEQGTELFGAVSWPSMFINAVITGDGRIVERCREFLRETEGQVRWQGLGGWLSGMAQDAALALATGKPSSRMPFMRTMSPKQVDRFLDDTARGKKRFGTKEQREGDMNAYATEMYRMAAHGVLRWGEGGCRATEVAAMILSNSGLGICMLRDDEYCAEPFANGSGRYERLTSYIRTLQVEADLEYATEMGGEGLGSDPGDGTGGACSAAGGLGEGLPDTMVESISRRYSHDARKLVAACRRLWDAPIADPDTLMDVVESTGQSPDLPLWENPLFLREVADSLLGPWCAAELTEGFATRRRDLFEHGVQILEICERHVGMEGIGMLPLFLIAAKTMLFDQLPHPTKSQMADHNRICGNIVDDMAYMLLMRVPDQKLARNMALAVMEMNANDPTEVLGALALDDADTRYQVWHISPKG